MEKLDAVTVTVLSRRSAGMLKPAGTPTVSTVVPPAAGANALLELTLSPGLKIAGLPTIVPTAGVPLVTGTLTVSPPRTAWLANAMVAWSSRAGATYSVVLLEKLVVVRSQLP